MPKPAIYITACLLFVGMLPLPYGYYMLLRFIACGIFAWAAFIAFDKNENTIPWILVILAITFNPIFKIHFPKEMWVVINLCSGVFLLAISKKIHSANQQDPMN